MTMRPAPRVGVMGGTFDPVHRGHIEAAAAACAALGLDRVLVVPSRVPPHRPDRPAASPYHRFAMVALAVLDQPGFEASDLELLRPGPSYTATTLAALHRRGLAPSQLFFIIGADAFAEIATWHAYPALLDAAHFVVVSRPGHCHDEVLARAPEVARRVCDLRGLPSPRAAVPRQPGVLFISAATTDVSSTSLREMLVSGAAVNGLLPGRVGEYIRRHGLYAPAQAAIPLHG